MNDENMLNQNNENNLYNTKGPTQKMKTCKYCQMEIPKKAKICPNCRKKQSGKLKWIVIVVVIIIIIAAIAGSGDDDTDIKKTGEAGEESQQENIKKGYNVGDVVETDGYKITYISAGQYESTNEFMQPKEGYVYWQFEFKFENISDSDKTVSTLWDWECYVDNSKVDQTWVGDDSGLDATLSSGRETQGTIYFEVPEDAKSIELEYTLNTWDDDKIIFIGK